MARRAGVGPKGFSAFFPGADFPVDAASLDLDGEGLTEPVALLELGVDEDLAAPVLVFVGVSEGLEAPVLLDPDVTFDIFVSGNSCDERRVQVPNSVLCPCSRVCVQA
jgi:hypothetical protein